ncbi:MAG: hypothetical protein HZC28_07055 [Spirochaetes bacterium]|nr:hypothetical protein [Spirochaetota bacterium]
MLLAAPFASAEFEWVHFSAYAEVGGAKWLGAGGEMYAFDRLLSLTVGTGYTEGYDPAVLNGYARYLLIDWAVRFYISETNAPFRLSAGARAYTTIQLGNDTGHRNSIRTGLILQLDVPMFGVVPYAAMYFIPGQSRIFRWDNMSGIFGYDFDSDSDYDWRLSFTLGVKLS